jgi:hypothetical protein
MLKILSVVKRCGRCKKELPESSFNRSGGARQHWCRECFRAYFRNRGAVHRAQVAVTREAKREPLRRRLLEHLAMHPCADCGERDLRVLEFDHVDAKQESIGGMLNRGVPLHVLEGELDRCDVVCANCHRRRTARRAQWSRLTDAPCRTSAQRPRVLRNLSWVYDQLRNSACVDCGIRDPLLLEHDHVGEKRAGVMALAWNEYSIEALASEVAMCEVRCCNCHRRRTADAQRSFRAAAVTLAGKGL